MLVPLPACLKLTPFSSLTSPHSQPFPVTPLGESPRPYTINRPPCLFLKELGRARGGLAEPSRHAPSAPAAGPSASGAASGSRPPRRGRPPACVCYRTAAAGGTAVRAGGLGIWAGRPGSERLWRCGRQEKGRGGSKKGRPGRGLTRCRVFCRLLRRILRISSSLSLDSAGRMRSEFEDLGWIFLGQQSTDQDST